MIPVLKGYTKSIIADTINPKYTIGFRPISSHSFPENGLEMAADITQKMKIYPLYSSPPKLVRKSFSSGKIKLKEVMNSNMFRHNNQKSREYLFSKFFNDYIPGIPPPIPLNWPIIFIMFFLLPIIFIILRVSSNCLISLFTS